RSSSGWVRALSGIIASAAVSSLCGEREATSAVLSVIVSVCSCCVMAWVLFGKIGGRGDGKSCRLRPEIAPGFVFLLICAINNGRLLDTCLPFLRNQSLKYIAVLHC